MKISNHTSAIIIAIVFISLLALAWKPIFGWHQPYINWAPWDLAEHLAEHGRSPRECLDLIYFEIMSPSEAEQQALCVYEYAKLTKDPSACELLMPSSYGLDCVGAAITARKMCTLNEETVSWWENEEKEIVGRVSFESCKRGDSSGTVKRNQCCLIARVTRVRGLNDCSSLTENEVLHDECLSGLAFKNRAPETCLEIHDKNLQSACLVRTKAMKENPSICKGCREPLNNLSELK